MGGCQPKTKQPTSTKILVQQPDAKQVEEFKNEAEKSNTLQTATTMTSTCSNQELTSLPKFNQSQIRIHVGDSHVRR